MSSPSEGVKEKSVVSKDGLKPFIIGIELLKTLFVLNTIVSLIDSTKRSEHAFGVCVNSRNPWRDFPRFPRFPALKTWRF
jgi:hypothetical protein